jgi:hypothetical protein
MYLKNSVIFFLLCLNKSAYQQTIMFALFVAFGVVLVAGLVVVPVLEEADARCEGFKKNGDLCKPKKIKDNA